MNHFSHKNHGWYYELGTPDETTGTATLRIWNECHEDDPGKGANFAISAFWRACEILEMKTVGGSETLGHSGGAVTGTVTPDDEADEEDSDE